MTRLILVLFACLALLSGWLSIEGQPRGVSADPANGEFMAAPAHVSPVPCMSYAPYRRKGDAPWHASRPIRPEQIREDLRLLMPLTRCIRTYGVEHGLEAVPAVARELGFKVRLGVWIGGDRTGNQAHLEQAIALAREYHDVVDLLVVGNEVLLRGELPLHELTGLLDQARAAQPAPVAYADVWEFWQRHASELKSHVDVAAIHILPYWEDHPVGIDHALAHVKAVRHSMQRELAPLPVWLAETGWPSAGRQRGAARPGLTEQARFVRQWAQEARPDDNLIEAFDQPWKRDLEGAMGGHWGMLDAQGRAKFAWTGALPAAIALEPALAALLTGALLGGILGFYLATSTRLNPVEANQIEQVAPTDCAGKTEPTQKQAIFALAGGLAGACLGPLILAQTEMILIWGRTPIEIVAASAYALLCLLGAVLALYQSMVGRGARRLQVFMTLLLLSTAGLALALVLDGRYRPLVWPLLIAPSVAFLLPTAQPFFLAGRSTLRHSVLLGIRYTALLGVSLCLICSVLLIHQEGWANTQALYCALAWVLLALGGLRQLRMAARSARAGVAENTRTMGPCNRAQE